MLGKTPAELAETFTGWNEGDLESFLIEITAEVLATADPRDGGPLVDVILEPAEQKGTGRWTVQIALDLGTPVSGIAEAVFGRSLSGHAEQRDAARAVLPGRPPARVDDPEAFTEDVRQGAVRVEGGRLRAGVRHDHGRCRRVRLGDRPGRDGDDLARRLHHPGPVPGPDQGGVRRLAGAAVAAARRRTSPTRSSQAQESWRRVVDRGDRGRRTGARVPSALAYYDGLRRDRLPAALIQGLRDLFGAHTYRRTDADGSFHIDWSGDKSEQPG